MPSTPESSVLRPDGTVFTSDVNGKVIEADTAQCCHCGRHFVIVRGSGKVRSFCRGCMRVTCGRKACVEECNPWRKRMESSLPHV
jgi:hypothetical protein